MKKRLLLLGGSSYLLPVIEKAHALGLYVITCDYLPHNAAHPFADEYANVSIIEKDEVLAMAREKNVDGVMSFACDPGVVAAAYVAEKMGLPFQGSYESVSLLQDKGRFRQFLIEHGFNSPHAKSYTDAAAPLKDVDFFTWPVIVKPTDGAGSKGVTKVEKPSDLPSAIATALAAAHNGTFIVEDFITFESCHSSTDMFTIDGRLCAVSYSDQLFDKDSDNPYTPTYIVWPTTMAQKHQDYLTRELQRLMTLLKMRTGIYNIETVVGKGGVPYIMEVSPRGGGDHIAEIQELAFGATLIENEIRSAVGMPLIEMKEHPIEGAWCEMVVHASHGQQGIFDHLEIRPDVREANVRMIDLMTKPGDAVLPFTGANRALGHLFLQFPTREALDAAIRDPSQWLKIVMR